MMVMVLLALMSAAAEWEIFALEVRVTLMAEAEACLELAMLLAAAH